MTGMSIYSFAGKVIFFRVLPLFNDKYKGHCQYAIKICSGNLLNSLTEFFFQPSLDFMISAFREIKTVFGFKTTRLTE